jgi:hypothetical protein
MGYGLIDADPLMNFLLPIRSAPAIMVQSIIGDNKSATVWMPHSPARADLELPAQLVLKPADARAQCRLVFFPLLLLP